MGRYVRLVVFGIGVFGFLAWLPGCSSGKAVTTSTFPIPAIITLAPAPTMSLEIGQTQGFSVSIESAVKTTITEPVEFQSSDPSIVSVSASGVACAGVWNSITNPTLCAPGRAGVATITAKAQGVNSAPTTVYVHQHIDNVQIVDACAVSNPPAPCTVPRGACQSLNENAIQNTVYEAHAFAAGVDITPSVGQFSWLAVNPAVATLSNTAAGLILAGGISLNQVEATPKTPGVTAVYAIVGTATSQSVNFTTCAVQSIALSVQSASGTSQTIEATVTDSLGNVILSPGSKNSIGLTWSSSDQGSVTVGSTGTTTGASTGGGATIVASCTPPTCNIGFEPTLPIYPENAIQIIANPSSTTNTAGTTVYVGSTGCGTTENCFSTIFPVTVPANTIGNPIPIPATPNSLVFNGQGSKGYLGTNFGLSGTKGLMVLDTGANTITQFPSTPGKVLAASPDGTKVVVSDTNDSPQAVFVFDTTANASVALAVSGASAAAFSPDSLKAYIVAGSTLYVYSKLDSLRTLPLQGPANDVAFFAEGAFGYIAGGTPAGVMVRRTCDNGEADAVTTPGVPTLITPLPNAKQMLAVESPRVDLINVNATPSGCTPTVSDTVTSFDLGHGTFVPTQVIVSSDGSIAYILASGLNSILVFNIGAQTSSSISLVGNPVPLSESLSADGTLLIVGSSDGLLHTVQTATGVDVGQAQFPLGLCQNTAGQKFTGVTCNPDLVVVKP